MNKVVLSLAVLAALSLSTMLPAHAQITAAQANQAITGGPVFVPDTTAYTEADRGVRSHTNHLILARNPDVFNPGAGYVSGFGGGGGSINPAGGLGPGGGMTPAQIRAFYGIPSTGGAGVIAIVDAYDYPTAVKDFNVFSAQFGLPQETGNGSVFQVVYAGNKKPRSNGGWAQEAALDIEWAHAMAPNAKIVLVEANSASYTDLFAAVDKASKLAGVKQVSMSWGGGEFSGETSYDSHFPQNNGVVYFASSGDTGGVVEYPSCSPNVVAVGGTSVATNSSGGFVSETGWSGSGGGTSQYEAKPTYQSALSAARRAVPDISSDADPNTGVSVYDSTSYQGFSGWLVFGGTSVACPTVAGMTNLAGSSYFSSKAELTTIYGGLGGSNYRDITSGHAGSFSCTVGWDFVTGVGSPQGLFGL